MLLFRVVLSSFLFLLVIHSAFAQTGTSKINENNFIDELTLLLDQYQRQLNEKTELITILPKDSLLLDEIINKTKTSIKKSIVDLDQIFKLRTDLRSAEESMRLSALFLAIQQQQATVDASLALRKSLKKRTYISLGLGLLSSALIFVGSDNNSDGFKYGGAAVSLLVPIISVAFLNKQIKNIAPQTEVDYSVLKQTGFPHDQQSIAFVSTYLKVEISRLSNLLETLDNLNTSLSTTIDKISSPEELHKYVEQIIYLIEKTDSFYIYELSKFDQLLKDPYNLAGFEPNVTKQLSELSNEIRAKISFWNNNRNLTNQTKENLFRFIDLTQRTE
ncbi:hypothetical protein QQ008_20465 [Fulvivirgaceae bacterium BMA10]|uniref:Uncharacterized protein n=1 Tax=Splendidivirga corallicola TaxID=3051826 RepID=A0ABT8KSQ8_9BACT|nr:hypothetical protein [Fulvivirgaceae bacterium BMA10]